jgi:hypothetical protein
MFLDSGTFCWDGRREGAYKLEAAALAGMGEPELGLWLYGQACQPTTCVQGEPSTFMMTQHMPSALCDFAQDVVCSFRPCNTGKARARRCFA